MQHDGYCASATFKKKKQRSIHFGSNQRHPCDPNGKPLYSPFFSLFNKICHHVHDQKRITIEDKTFCVMVSLRALNWTNTVSKMGLRTH